jgi:hypothetical protein
MYPTYILQGAFVWFRDPSMTLIFVFVADL